MGSVLFTKQFIKSLSPIKFFIPLPADLNIMVDSAQKNKKRNKIYVSAEKKLHFDRKFASHFLDENFSPFSGDMARLSR